MLPDPPREYSLMPFWFWNDTLDERELLRQIDDFEAHGVYGFVIHPRVGLPRDCGWMSDKLLHFMRVAIDEAARRGQTVILYDEGMYPSGSAGGQVVAADPSHACRCLALADPDAPLPGGHELVHEGAFNGKRFRVVNRPADSVIRGLHYLGDGPEEEEPAMGDILNPDGTASFIRLVYDRYHSEFGEHFGKTIKAIFTDEPNALGRCREKTVWPGTAGILEHVNRLLGEDFTPHLPALWFDDAPDAERHRQRYRHAIRLRMEETWYRPLYEWCEAHNVALCGHPDRGDEIGCQRFFQWPGQDLVWRFVEPDTPTAIEGAESTQGKASSSAAIHLGRARNGNEFCGAYGPETTYDEFKWLAYWCLVRGVDLLIPHAFYYTVRGPRKVERPPQIGPNGPWWDQFKPFADACRRLCWLNATGRHVCDVAILTSDQCPWRAAKSLFEHQIDFNYLEDRLLLEGVAKADGEAIAVGPMRYRALVVEDEALLTPAVVEALSAFEAAGRVVHWPTTGEAVGAVSALSEIEPWFGEPEPALRVRQFEHDGARYAMLFNEVRTPTGELAWSSSSVPTEIDPATARESAVDTRDLRLDGHALRLFRLD